MFSLTIIRNQDQHRYSLCFSNYSPDEFAIFTGSIHIIMIKRWVLKEQGDH